jgi:hypothetical protein
VLVPVKSDRHREVHHELRCRKVGAGQSVRELHQPGRAEGNADTGQGRPPDASHNIAGFCHGFARGDQGPWLSSLGRSNRNRHCDDDSAAVDPGDLCDTRLRAEAAWLVELFPSRIRYSGMSLPYHIGSGWVGGFLPATVFAIVAATGNIYSGLWYPVGVAAMSLVIGFFFLPETRDVDITQV